MRNSCGHGPRRKERVRCAIYTRKSSEEGLEQEFNSLQAQREACEAFINSQRHEGWVSLPKAYDDGGFSGATADRPALQRLLADITAGRVDTIVVYKIDRLTRSLADFAKIVEILDARGASFVSVTQQFNTTTSMGRLTLNILLSFAQFEREVIGERIRDKIAASKQKGMWMGGIPPLGYRVHDRKLVIVEGEAELVRDIFCGYAALGSVRLLKDEFEARGIKSKSWTSASGRRIGAKPFSRGALYLILQNRLYRGEIVHKGQSHPGEHTPIIDQPLWDAVQAQLAANTADRNSGTRTRQPSLLAGEHDGLAPLVMYSPHGVFIALEDLGYLLTGAALVFAGLAITDNSGIGRTTRWLLMAAGAAVVVSFAVLALREGADLADQFEIIAISIDWLALAVAGSLLVVLSRRRAAPAADSD